MKILVQVSLLLGMLSCVTTSEAPLSPQASNKTVVGWNFDWDDNIMYMPTKIVLFKKNSNQEFLMDTGSFAVHRKSIGKPGRYIFKGKNLANYQVLTAKNKNSFRYFRDGKNQENYFLDDLKVAFKQSESVWKGPSWDAFVFALGQQSSAKRTTIITARGHSPKAVIQGLKYLKKIGKIKYLIPEGNIYTVSNPKISARFSAKGGAANPSAIKAEIMKTILDDLQKVPVSSAIKPSINRDGNGVVRQHLWGFSDDDWGNYEKAVSVLSSGVAKNRWPNVKVVVFYTGRHDKKRKQQIRVLKSDGSVRPRIAAEAREGFVKVFR